MNSRGPVLMVCLSVYLWVAALFSVELCAAFGLYAICVPTGWLLIPYSASIKESKRPLGIASYNKLLLHHHNIPLTPSYPLTPSTRTSTTRFTFNSDIRSHTSASHQGAKSAALFRSLTRHKLPLILQDTRDSQHSPHTTTTTTTMSAMSSRDFGMDSRSIATPRSEKAFILNSPNQKPKRKSKLTWFLVLFVLLVVAGVVVGVVFGVVKKNNKTTIPNASNPQSNGSGSGGSTVPGASPSAGSTGTNILYNNPFGGNYTAQYVPTSIVADLFSKSLDPLMTLPLHKVSLLLLTNPSLMVQCPSAA